MSRKLTVQGKVAREVITSMPNASQAAIARFLYETHRNLFHSVSQARNMVRWHLGKRKNGNRGSAADPLKLNKIYTPQNPYGLPDSYEEKREPFILPKVNNNILILSDLHIPYHTISAINCALDYGKRKKINTIFINGDLLDFHGMSRFEKDPRKRTIPEEMDAAITFLKALKKAFPKVDIYYHLGNHDMRYEKWLMAHPEIFGDPYYELESRLGLLNLGVRMIDDKTITKAGKLSIHHGHYLFRGSQSPVSPARTVMLKAKQSMLCGHTHKMSESPATDIDGNVYACWSTGCLCELSPDYAPMANDYGHGFAHVTINKDNTFVVRNIRVVNGKIF